MFLKVCIIIVSFVGFIGCAEDLGDKEVAKPFEVATKSLLPSFKVSVEGSGRAEAYDVLIEWQEAHGTVRISEGSKILAVVPGSQKSFLHEQVTHDRQMAYLLEQLSEDGRVLASIPLFVVIPKDVVLAGEIKLKEPMIIEAQRVFLRSDLKLFNFEHDLHISAGEVHSENALIQNFPSEAQGPRSGKGRNGGRIVFQAKKTQGSLRIVLVGEKGGAGKDGAITVPGRHPGCAGSDGGAGGNAGSLTVEVTEDSAMNISYENMKAEGGRAGMRGVAKGSESPDEVIGPPCRKDAPEGREGAAGERGRVCLRLSPAIKFTCSE